MRILGVDPGLSGGLALLDAAPRRVVDVVDVPTSGEKAKRRVDAGNLLFWLRAHMPIDAAFLERAQAMPGQGSSSGFLYGRAVGYLECAIIGMEIPITFVESASWKKALGLIRKGKEDSRQLALTRFPAAVAFFARKLDHNRAEALLIAAYGLEIGLRR